MEKFYVLVNPVNGIFDKKFSTWESAKNFMIKNNCGYYCIMTFLQAKNWMKKLEKKISKMSFETTLGMNY